MHTEENVTAAAPTEETAPKPKKAKKDKIREAVAADAAAEAEQATEAKPEGATKSKPTAEEKELARKERERVKREKADAKAAEVKAKNEAKEIKRKEREAKKLAEQKEARKPVHGVIYNIALMLARSEGASKREIREHLTSTFPDKNPDEMNTTLGIQLSRLQKQHNVALKKHEDPERGGKVYKSPANLPHLVETRSVRPAKSPVVTTEEAPAA